MQKWSESADGTIAANSKYGENIFLKENFPTAIDPNDELAASMVDEWYKQIAAYNFSKPENSDETEYFTQLAWRSTKSLGCDCTPKENGDDKEMSCKTYEIYCICNYDPPGNIAK